MTSASGPGILGQWSSAGGNVGLAAGDAICVALATAANLPEPQTFVAWLSESNDDAYCRVHGFSGKKSAQCGQQSLPTGAGPWQRTDGMPFMGALASASTVAPVYTPLARDEQQQVVLNDRLFTGTLADGTANARRCGDWLVMVTIIQHRLGQQTRRRRPGLASGLPGADHVPGYEPLILPV